MLMNGNTLWGSIHTLPKFLAYQKSSNVKSWLNHGLELFIVLLLISIKLIGFHPWDISLGLVKQH